MEVSTKERLAALARQGASHRHKALEELQRGKKKSHWIWWVFPTLATRGGDVFSRMEHSGIVPDLASVEEASSYAAYPPLRDALLLSMVAADEAFTKSLLSKDGMAPFAVLDLPSGREPDGVFTRGPVDAFKVRCSATLFAVIAYRSGDTALCSASVRLLAHFKGGQMVYAAHAEGESGYTEDKHAQRTVLSGPDEPTLKLLGADWEQVLKFAHGHTVGTLPDLSKVHESVKDEEPPPPEMMLSIF